jgi:general secretion pathway protein H
MTTEHSRHTRISGKGPLHVIMPCRAFMISSGTGFTLLEIIMVIFIVSLVLAISLPTFTGIGERKITSDARRIASILRYLNDSALSTKETLFMKADLAQKVIWFSGPEGEKSERFETMSGIELQSRGMISEGQVTIFFGPAGALESFRVLLRDHDRVLTITLNSVNGKVKVVASNGE